MPGTPLKAKTVSGRTPADARSTCRGARGPHRIDRLVGQTVDTLIAGITGMTLHPAPFDLMPGRQRVEPLPKILVLDRLAVRGLPAARFPAFDPFGNPAAHVLGIRKNTDLRGSLQSLERTNHCCELHAIVGRECLGTRQLLLVLSNLQKRAPAPR